MKIIKVGSIPKTKKYIEIAKCLKCQTEAEFDRGECERISWSCGYRTDPYKNYNIYEIKCPICGSNNFIGESKEIEE